MEETFDNFFADRGGIDKCPGFTINGLSGQIYNSFLNLDIWIKTKYKDIPPIYCNFINNTYFNACARKVNNAYFIGINIGAYYLLNDIFSRMLSCPTILEEFGDSSKEIKPRPLFNAQITDLTTLLNSKEEDVLINLPKDHQRLYFSQFLTSTAMKFLFLHEYGHIANGHLDLKFSLDKSTSFYEINNFKHTDTISALDLQTLEMDADCYAVCKGIIEILDLNKNCDSISEPFIKDFFGSLDKCIYLWVFAVYTFFRIFGFRKCSVCELESYTHPPIGLRQHFVITTLDAFFDKNKIAFRSELLETWKKTIIGVEKAFEEISEQGYDVSQFRFAMKNEVFEHGRKIMRNWNNIRPMLQNYAFCELAPLDE